MLLVNQINELYYKSVHQRELQILTLSSKENELYMKIAYELKINSNNLSGFFCLAFKHSYLFKTPSFVWQTWLYHRFIHDQTKKQNNEFPLISLESIYNDMCLLIDKGYFNMDSRYNKTLLKYLLIEWSKVYEKLGVITAKSKVLKEIRYDSIPILETLQENISIEIYYNYILPYFNYQFDFNNSEVPNELKKAVYIFETTWKNNKNGYYINQEFKISNFDTNNKNNVPIIIFTDNQTTLKTALVHLKDEQKRAIAAYLKSGKVYSTNEICDLLIKDFNLNSDKDDKGNYKIFPFVDEYIFSSLWLWDI